MSKFSKFDRIKSEICFRWPFFVNYVRSWSFIKSSFAEYEAKQLIAIDREYFITNREPDLMPYWSRVEKDLDEILLENGKITKDDYARIQNRYRHIADKIMRENNYPLYKEKGLS